jgi:uncharacterized protein (TIRG00374 family)
MNKPHTSTYRNLIAVIILIITFFGVYHVFTTSVDLGKVRGLLSGISPSVIAAMLVFSTSIMFVRAFRFYLLLKDYGIKLTYFQALKVYMAGQALSPLPGGEGSRTVLLKMESGTDISDAVTPLIILGISEMIVAVAITLVGSAFLNILRLAAVISLVGVAGLIWLLINHKVVKAVFKVLPNNKKVEKAEESILETQDEVKEAIFKKKSWKPSDMFIHSLFLALITDLFGGAIIYVRALYFKLPLSFLFSLYIFAAATVLGELVPFSPGGVGPTEGGMTGILLLSGVALAQSVAVVLIFRGVTLLYSIVVGLVFLFTFYSRKYVQYMKSAKAAES